MRSRFPRRIGNGEVTKKLTAAYGCAVFGVDVNELAVKRIAASTDVSLSSIELIRGDLVSWARTTTAGLFDVVFFNPPYVATDAEEMRRARTCRDIAASWAGGDDGREVINEILRTVRSVLVDQGVFYLVVERANNVNEILDLAASCGLGSGGVVLSRNAGMELLHVLRFICPKI